MTAGYSEKPLAAKLGMKPGQRVWREDMPAEIAREIGDTGALLIDTATAPIDLAHIFKTERSALASRLTALRPLLAPSGCIWVSWPKRVAGIETDITENVIREICLPMGLVDVKVCALDATWSGLKLMIRRSERANEKGKRT